MGTEGITMHIDRANEIAVTREPAGAASPISAFGLMMMPTYRTPATGSSFGAGEAQDAGLCRFVREVVDVLAVLPQRHPLIVMATSIPVAHAVWVADEEGTDLILYTEVNDRPGRFMAQISDTSLIALAGLVPGALQLLPPARVL